MTANVERLTNRLASTPLAFRGRVSGDDAVRVDAVVADLFRDRASRRLEPTEVAKFVVGKATPARIRHLELVLIASWVLHDTAFAGAPADAMVALLINRIGELASITVPRLFVEDGERREELVRTCLAAFDRVPEGETRAAAEDRLAVLDSVRRRALLRDARVREEAREAERQKRKAELERLKQQEEEERRQAARTTHED
ncbi:MAG: hypothetical protein ABI867_27975 [Kofleriaceae bacterium]